MYGMKNIVKEDKKWAIYKTTRGKTFYYGRYSDLNACKKIRDLLIKLNWGEPLPPMKYIRKRNGYEINKNVNGKLKYFGRYDSLEEAQLQRALLIENDWSAGCD